MVLPTSNGDNKVDPTAITASKNEIDGLEADIAEISELAQTNPALLGGDDVAQLLERLSSAENVADGVESKLDSVLQNLDKLLAALDGAGQQQPTDAKEAAHEPKAADGTTEFKEQ
ncbi:hypothetical protein D9619_002708 [Psilocybe cf. subviscida]|uniref:Uncharacterized protein n=1 Tax=Psilocybe cf. subviscida TaxID=2480587 RepID=A0A8H5AW93_9AGAR|nr:hypothetical protein D9619_002708 [Psilocybe cf. subviscida]